MADIFSDNPDKPLANHIVFICIAVGKCLTHAFFTLSIIKSLNRGESDEWEDTLPHLEIGGKVIIWLNFSFKARQKTNNHPCLVKASNNDDSPGSSPIKYKSAMVGPIILYWHVLFKWKVYPEFLLMKNNF